MKKRISGIVLMLAMLILMGMSVSAAPAAFATVASSQIVDSSTVQFTATLPSVPATDDGMLYLYELKAYEEALPAGATPNATAPASQAPVFNFALNRDQGAKSRLYTKTVLVGNIGGVPTMLSNPQWISNPEKVATTSRRDTRPVKTTQNDELTNLLISGKGAAAANAAFVRHTVQVLCNDVNSVVCHPYAKGAIAETHPISHQYYMLNAADDAGIAGLVADMTYYAGQSIGQDFLIGNEMNERIWNYIAYVPWDIYVKEYEQSFRICYNAIKSTNAQAKVYISLDQCWDRNRPTSHAEYYTYIDGKDFLDKFNARILSGGNIDWDIAIHPYTVPLTNAAFWTVGGYEGAQVKQNKMVSFQNMSVITSYLAQPTFLNRAGAFRDVIINEIGLDARQGDVIQGAAIAASWYAFEINPMITQYMYLPNFGDGVDARLAGQGLAVYNAMGTPDEAGYLEWAKSVIGIADWSQVIK